MVVQQGQARVNMATGKTHRTLPAGSFKKASQVVADALRHEIGMGLLLDNALLPPEQDMIERFGVSRPTLREAMRILETEGLLTTARGGNKGHRIHHPSARQAARQASLSLRLRGASVIDVFILASILVPPAVRMVAETHPLPDISRLRELHQRLAESRDRPREMTRLVREFDVAVCNLCGNEAIAFISEVMAEVIELQIDEFPEETSDLPPENIAEVEPSWHRMGKVIDAIASQDGALAERLTQERLREIVSYHRRVVGASPPLRMLT